jgi:hypothetical protein
MRPIRSSRTSGVSPTRSSREWDTSMAGPESVNGKQPHSGRYRCRRRDRCRRSQGDPPHAAPTAPPPTQPGIRHDPRHRRPSGCGHRISATVVGASVVSGIRTMWRARSTSWSGTSSDPTTTRDVHCTEPKSRPLSTSATRRRRSPCVVSTPEKARTVAANFRIHRTPENALGNRCRCGKTKEALWWRPRGSCHRHRCSRPWQLKR